MQAAHAIPPGQIIGTADERVVIYGVAWNSFEAILALRGDAPMPRMTYLEGALELMTPSRNHESIKTLLARLIEYYAVENGIRLSGYGSWTLRSAPSERAVEPDECYIVGDARSKDRPDLAIEVVWTSGGLDKLEVYRGLRVEEVWFWQEDRIRVYRLCDESYIEAPRSHILPNLDLQLLARLAGYEDQTAALAELRDAQRAG